MTTAHPPLRRFLATLAAALPLAGLVLAAPASAAVVISQVYGGGGNTGATLKHDFIELFNNGTAPVAIGGWSVQYASATGTSWQLTPIPAGTTLQPGRYLLVRQAAGTGGSVDVVGDVTGSIAMGGGSGKVALAANSTAFSGTVPTGAIDFVGYGTATTAEGSPAPALSGSTAALRNGNGCAESNSNSADFSIAAPAPRSAASPANLCSSAPANQPIAASCPAASVAAGSAAVLSTSATDPDSIVTGAAATGTWPAGISLLSFTAANAAGGTATQTVQVAAGTTPGTYTLGLQWGNSDAQTASCNLTVTIAGVTPISSIQGSGRTSPMADSTVVTSGVVTKVHNNGFFLQDPVGDGNPLTSDGIFVFTSTAPTVSAGQKLQLSAQVTEFNTGATDANARTLTELTSPTGITVLGSGFSVAPVPVTLPVAAVGDLERYEGMLVTISGPLTVAQNFFQGRYGQLTLAAGGRLETPTNRHRPGPLAAALADENARRTILLDDGSSNQNPNPIPYLASGARAGDTVGAITGVIDYGLATSSSPGLGLYKIHPVAAPVFSLGNPRTSAPDAVGGNVKVASFNVLNYFTAYTNGGGTANGCSLGGATSTSNCRGADNATEFARQQAKIVEAMVAINADVLGLMEIQNNGNTAAQNLVNALNARMGAGTYATTALPANTGDDAIRVAMVYKPARLSAVGAAVSDTNAINNRPTLAQTFSLANGEKFTLFVNHFKSKGSCPAAGDTVAGNFDSGDGQGCWNLLRTQQAQRLSTFAAERLAATGTSDALVIGDLNAYGQEDPVNALTSNGYADQVRRFDAFGYSYVFDGGAGRLDHAIANTAMAARVNRVAHWHINADESSITDYNTEYKAPETRCGAGGTSACPADPYTATPYRSSDHDPVVIGLNLYNRALVGTSGRDTLTGGPADDLIWASAGADTLTGGAGSNGFAWRSLREAGSTITDFVPGKDRIDLSALLASIQAPSTTAIARGVVRLVASGANTLLQIDTDGSAGAVQPRTLVTLRNVVPSAIDPRRDLGLN